MTSQNSDLFYDIYNTINENNSRQTQYFSSIFLNYFDTQKEVIMHITISNVFK